MTTPDLEQYFPLLDRLAAEAMSSGHSAVSFFEECPASTGRDIDTLVEIRRFVATEGDLERVAGYLETGYLRRFDSANRAAAFLCVLDLEDKLSLARWRRSCANYQKEQPLFVAAPQLWDQTYPPGKAAREMIRCGALAFDEFNQLVTVGTSTARLHGAVRSQLFTWLCREFQREKLYVRLHPYDVSPDLLPVLEEVALRPSDPKWWRDLKVWPGTKKASVYELDECSYQQNLRQYWDREVRELGRLEVAFRRDNSGLLSCMIEELPRLNRRGFIVGYCLHLTSESPVGTSWIDGITTHIDGAINLYFDGRQHERLQSTLELGKVVDASCRTHLFRVDDAPLATLLPMAQQFFRSECLVEEWIRDQFGDGAANGMKYSSPYRERALQ